MRLDPLRVAALVKAALEEDLGENGDITTAAVIPAESRTLGRVVARQPLIVCGIPLAREVFRRLDYELSFRELHADGERVAAGSTVAEVWGRSRPILEGERTALNFMMRLSGIATAARAAVDEIEGTGAVILDTRKTAPGLRHVDKYAVFTGGAVNHRFGLHDAVMIKDTHLETVESLGQAIAAALATGIPAERVTAEVRDLDQLDQAIAAGAGRALLDNMDLDGLRAAVSRARGRIVLEASGGLRPGALREVAATGVDAISLGYLTHSTPAADLALEMEPIS